MPGDQSPRHRCRRGGRRAELILLHLCAVLDRVRRRPRPLWGQARHPVRHRCGRPWCRVLFGLAQCNSRDRSLRAPDRRWPSPARYSPPMVFRRYLAAAVGSPSAWHAGRRGQQFAMEVPDPRRADVAAGLVLRGRVYHCPRRGDPRDTPDTRPRRIDASPLWSTLPALQDGLTNPNPICAASRPDCSSFRPRSGQHGWSLSWKQPDRASHGDAPSIEPPRYRWDG